MRDYLSSHPELVVPGAELRFNVVGPIDVPGFVDGWTTDRRRHRDRPCAGRLVDRADRLRAGFRLRMRAAAVGGGPPVAARSLVRFRCGRAGHQVVRRATWPAPGSWSIRRFPRFPFRTGSSTSSGAGRSSPTWMRIARTPGSRSCVARWLPTGISSRASTGRTAGPDFRSQRSGESATAASSSPGPRPTRGSTRRGIRPRGTPATISTSHWSRFVEIAAYVPRGFGLQDVVVGKRRD